MDVGHTLQFTQKLLNSMIGLWKQLKINIDYQPPQRLSFKIYFTYVIKTYDISYRFIHLFAKSSQDKIVTIKLHTK